MNAAYVTSLASALCLNTAMANASCEAAISPTVVSAIYPTANALPENLLRFYIYFSKPMKREDILDSIYLADQQGKKLNGVFLHNKLNLWSPDSRRLTLLFDPGRVKTGLVAHNNLGRALQAGKRYQLVIAATAEDDDGCTLSSDFSKSFSATQADFEAPDIERWQISAVHSGSLEPVSVTLNGAMDHLSLAYRLRIRDENGQNVPGRIALADQENRWIFTPSRPWTESTYQLTVNPVLEDIAGNRPTGLFDQPNLTDEIRGQQHWLHQDVPVISVTSAVN